MIIGRLRGTIAATGVDSVLIDVNGIGYVAQAGSRLLSRLSVGEEAELHIETKVTDSSITMYAFGSDEERAWFVRLQDVHGVAGKAANAVLDALTVTELMDAIALGDAATVMRAKGVGKKLAERITGELAGKPAPMGRFGSKFEVSGGPGIVSASEVKTGARGEAVSALVNLGYGQSDAARAVAAAAKGDAAAPVETLIKGALKELSS